MDIKKLNSGNWFDVSFTDEQNEQIHKLRTEIEEKTNVHHDIWGKLSEHELSFESKLVILEKMQNLFNEIKTLK